MNQQGDTDMRMINKPHDAATFIAQVGHFKLYECPRQGDESPLLCEYEGQWYKTGYFDVPSIEDLVDDFYGEPF
jgi:hypothetical protein